MTYHDDEYGVKEDPLAAHTGVRGRERTLRVGHVVRLVVAAPLVVALMFAGAQIVNFDESSGGGLTETDRELAILAEEREMNREKLNEELADGFEQIRLRNEEKAAEAARLEAEREEAERREAERVAAEQAEAARRATTTTSAPTPPPQQEDVSTGGGYEGTPPDSYWDRMAQCETGGNWAHFPYGTWTGGLGIYNQTWIGWGGGEFAPTAGQATREQQIIVANRIATQGYGSLGPVGYSAWGCLATVGYP